MHTKTKMWIQLTIPDALLGATVGAIMGSTGTFVLGEINRINQKRAKANRVRTALISEIEVISTSVSKLKDYVTNMDETVPPSTVFTLIDNAVHNEVYSANVSDISLLSDTEVKEVTRFYAHTNRLGDYSPNGDGSEWDASEKFIKLLDRQRQAAEDCITVLESNKEDRLC